MFYSAEKKLKVKTEALIKKFVINKAVSSLIKFLRYKKF